MSLFNLFGKKKDPKEQLREAKSEIRKNQRSIDRELFQLDISEKKVITEIKQYAKKGRTDAARELAKQVALLRKQKTRFITTKAKLNSVINELSLSVSTGTIAKSLENASKIMASLNRQLNPSALLKTTQDFAKGTMELEVKGDMINDAIDMAFDDADDEEETDQIVNSILDEIGVEIQTTAAKVPRTKLDKDTDVDVADTDTAEAAELEARLNALKSL